MRNAVETATLDKSRRPRALEIARHQAEQLGRLVDDLLDLARITQGRISLDRKRIDLADIIERAIDATRSLIESGGLRLTVVLPSKPVGVEADPEDSSRYS